jgi:MoxR-like ATPase
MYVLRPEEDIAIRALATQSGVRALLLEGPPGCGKTALGDEIALRLGARLVYLQCHSWTDDQELFIGVDVASAVAGDAAHVRQPGVLAIAAEASAVGPVVVVIDELDKAPERVDALLLDVLQTGRVPVRPGEHVRIALASTVFVLTSNGAREHLDALLRRVRRVRMRPLSVEILDRLARERSGAPASVVTVASKLARTIADSDGAVLSVQELEYLCRDLWQVAATADECRLLLSQWAARGDAGHRAALSSAVAPLWGEIVAARRRVAA